MDGEVHKELHSNSKTITFTIAPHGCIPIQFGFQRGLVFFGLRHRPLSHLQLASAADWHVGNILPAKARRFLAQRIVVCRTMEEDLKFNRHPFTLQLLGHHPSTKATVCGSCFAR